MKDAHAAWRAWACLIALIAASVLPAGAQAPDAGKANQPATPPMTLEQLTAKVGELEEENQTLKKTLDEINRKTAPREAWLVLGIVGGLFVLVWGGVARIREATRRIEAEAETQQKVQAAIDKQALAITSAVDTRIKAMAGLVQAVHPQPPTPGIPKSPAGIWESLGEVLRALGKPIA